MKRWIHMGLTVIVLGWGVWAAYGDLSAFTAGKHDPVEVSAESLPSRVPILRVEGLTKVEQVRTPSQIKFRSAPSGSVSARIAGEEEEPL